MGAVAVTPAMVGVADRHARRRNYLCGVSAGINGGAAIYIDTNGLAQLATSADTTHCQFAGIAIPTKNSAYAAGIGQAVDVVQWGEVEGFSLSGVAYWGFVYLADDGTFATTAGTKTVRIGQCVPTSDKDSSGNPRKLLMVMVPFGNVALIT